jgi:protein MAK16
LDESLRGQGTYGEIYNFAQKPFEQLLKEAGTLPEEKEEEEELEEEEEEGEVEYVADMSDEDVEDLEDGRSL